MSIILKSGNSSDLMAIKPASTAASASDPAAVFTISPNSVALPVTLSGGTVTANQGTAAALSAAWPVELSDGTNLLGVSAHPVRVDPTGTTTQPVSGTVGVSGTVAVTQSTSPWVVSLTSTTITGTVAVTQSGSWTVTANAGTNLNTSALALDTSVNGLLLAQGSTTSGEKGPLMQGAVTTGSPSYTTAQTSPLSLTLAGALRVDGSAVTQPVSGTVGVSGTVAVTQSTSPWVVSLTSTTITGTVAATQSGTWNIGTVSTLTSITNPVAVTGTFFQATQPVSIAAAVAVTQSTSPWVVSLTSTTITGTVAVTQSTSPWIVAGAGTAGTPATGVVTIQGITSGTPINTTLADVTGTGALGALNAAVQVNASGLETVGMQLAAGTLVGTLVAESSTDGGTTWNATYFDLPLGTKQQTIVFGSANAATPATLVGVGGANLYRVRVSAFTSGTANITLRATTANDPSVLFAGPTAVAVPPIAAMVGGSDGTLLQALRTAPINNGVQVLQVQDAENTRQSYTIAVTNLVVVTGATDIFVLTGSATKTIRITRITFTMSATTAVTVPFVITKHSTANTGGTSTAPVATPHDSNNAAATATGAQYTANPTAVGSLVGVGIRSFKYLAEVQTTPTGALEVLDLTFGANHEQPIVLRGTTQQMAINLGGTTISGGSANISITWTEDNT